MADLTADATLRLKGISMTERWPMDTSATRTFYRGQPMMLVAADTLNVTGWTGKSDIKSTDVCVGIAAEGKSVIVGDPEISEIEIYVSPAIIGFQSTVFTRADVGKAVYMEDSGTLENAAGAGGVPYIGTLFKVEDGFAYVQLVTPAICSGA